MTDSAEALREIRELTRGFAAAEVRPLGTEWERAGRLSDEVLAQLGELGFLGMVAPEAYGGMAVGDVAWLGALSELAWGDASLALAVALHGEVVRAVSGSSEAAKSAWLPALAAGSSLGAAPLDPAATACQATAAGDEWRLTGSASWVGNARPGGLLLVEATLPEERASFLVPLDSPGVHLAATPPPLGLAALAPATVELRAAVVPGPARLGPPPAGSGFALAVAAVAVGMARAALEHARDYADQREQFDCRLREFEGIQYKLADMATRVAAAAALLSEAGGSGDPGSAAMSKVCAAEAALYVTTQAVQVFGGYGYMRDYPVERLMREARAMSLIGGSDHAQRLRIAGLLYQEPAAEG